MRSHSWRWGWWWGEALPRLILPLPLTPQGTGADADGTNPQKVMIYSIREDGHPATLLESKDAETKQLLREWR